MAPPKVRFGALKTVLRHEAPLRWLASHKTRDQELTARVRARKMG